MNILMWAAVILACFFVGLGLRGGFTGDDAGSATCYRIAGAGVMIAIGAFAYQYFGNLPH